MDHHSKKEIIAPGLIANVLPLTVFICYSFAQTNLSNQERLQDILLSYLIYIFIAAVPWLIVSPLLTFIFSTPTLIRKKYSLFRQQVLAGIIMSIIIVGLIFSTLLLLIFFLVIVFRQGGFRILG